MKKLSILAVLLFATLFGKSQADVKIEHSTLAFIKEGEPKKIIGKIDGNICVYIKERADEPDRFQLYDKDLKLKNSGAIPIDDKNRLFLDSYIINNELYSFSILATKKGEKPILSLEQYNKQDLKRNDKSIVLENEASIEFTPTAGLKGHASLSFSKDSSLFSVAIMDKENIYLSLYKNDFSKLWSVTSKYSIGVDNNDLIYFVGMKLNQKGEVALLYKIRRKVAGFNNKFDYNLITVSSNGDKTSENFIPEGKKMTDLIIELDKNDKIYLAGINGSIESYMPEEIFYSELDMNTAKPISEKALKFTNKIFPERMDFKKEKEAEKSDFKEVRDKLKYNNILNLYQPNDHEYYFINQQELIIYMENKLHQYWYDNIYVHYYNSQSNAEWEVLIPRSNIYSFQEMGKIGIVYLNDKLTLLFNDCDANDDKSGFVEHVEDDQGNSSCVYDFFYATFDSKGLVERNVFSDSKADMFLNMPYYNFDNKEYYFLYRELGAKKYSEIPTGIMKITKK